MALSSSSSAGTSFQPMIVWNRGKSRERMWWRGWQQSSGHKSQNRRHTASLYIPRQQPSSRPPELGCARERKSTRTLLGVRTLGVGEWKDEGRAFITRTGCCITRVGINPGHPARSLKRQPLGADFCPLFSSGAQLFASAMQWYHRS